MARGLRGDAEADEQARAFHMKPLWRRALLRMPALIVTLMIEMFVALIVTKYADH